MPLSLLNHSALALFAQRTRIPTSARSTGFCAIWVYISSSSSSKEQEQIAVFGYIYARESMRTLHLAFVRSYVALPFGHCCFFV